MLDRQTAWLFTQELKIHDLRLCTVAYRMKDQYHLIRPFYRHNEISDNIASRFIRFVSIKSEAVTSNDRKLQFLELHKLLLSLLYNAILLQNKTSNTATLDPNENPGCITSEYAVKCTYYSLLVIFSYWFNQLISET
jgi:hypothetical protein